MKFFFPDSQDLVSPTYDFLHDEYLATRVRQRDDVYAHEVVVPPPYDGILVSKAIVDPSVARGAGKYTAPQRARLYRLGIRKFFRLPPAMSSIGDCGAFNYIDEEYPPYSVDEVLDFYEGCQFDAGVSIDHVIFGYLPEAGEADVDAAWVKRRHISLDLGEKFLAELRKRDSPLQPVGAAQGWSPASYADSVVRLQEMGYRRIALGGMVPLKTPEILDCLREIAPKLLDGTELHLLGINRVDSMERFAECGVTSFDSTSVFRQAFMDDRNNYHTANESYTAIRVPQVDGNPALKRRILSGMVSQSGAIAAERACLSILRAYDNAGAGIDEVLQALAVYEELVLGKDSKKKSYIPHYRRTLESLPWKDCPCALCREHGVEIVIFRGTERNKRRGFHNLSVLEARMRQLVY
ncbi:archaeosine tRNA-ribosyltransferase type 5 [Actinokineospora spheciospongiae]|uniref:Archaeosine tRNA-ribosyltransferase type 5 n=1 Tax=Actinokineospora spheciospongiae TaxID=909613 RepID=W7IXK1_9PSEU|nr:tRNA-guanine transglycosylase DpdA [Actinokineospora spheciospongiae]EWC61181.1 archaeosine tRNA-ribosyltransferase type 5 [Actinokineospora spheciospongiae]